MYISCCLVPRPHYSVRPIHFRSRGPGGEVFPARSPWIRHQSELTEEAWQNAVEGLGNISCSFHISSVPEELGRGLQQWKYFELKITIALQLRILKDWKCNWTMQVKSILFFTLSSQNGSFGVFNVSPKSINVVINIMFIRCILKRLCRPTKKLCICFW